jgi:hypothetical protein
VEQDPGEGRREQIGTAHRQGFITQRRVDRRLQPRGQVPAGFGQSATPEKRANTVERVPPVPRQLRPQVQDFSRIALEPLPEDIEIPEPTEATFDPAERTGSNIGRKLEQGSERSERSLKSTGRDAKLVDRLGIGIGVQLVGTVQESTKADAEHRTGRLAACRRTA